MRRIKFRAWSEQDKVMIYDLNSPRLFHGELISEGDDYIFMQSTDYFDSDGKDIFDQDIIRFFDTGNPWEGESNSEGIFQVVWNLETLQWDAVFSYGETLPLSMLDPSNLTVISNIHEKPKLLEETAS